jgi:hypothetical protein
MMGRIFAGEARNFVRTVNKLGQKAGAAATTT